MLDGGGLVSMTAGTYRRLLVPTDGSDVARRALDEAITVANLTGATIHVRYVVDDTTIAELATDPGFDEPSWMPTSIGSSISSKPSGNTRWRASETPSPSSRSTCGRR